MLKICLTGATGFIGKNLLKSLEKRNDVEVVALSRKISPEMDQAKKGNVTWRRCNGFSLLDVEKATEDCDILIYLIHSMQPTSTLSQGSFKDFDLYLADNFARASNKNKLKKIIYLSGLIPDEKNLSDHLKSRLEIEKTLAQFNNSVTTLRAGLIIGRNGSSFRILEKLIKRLKFLICPSWTLSKTQPIDLQDALKTIEYCIDNSSTLNETYDIGGPDVLTYKEMLQSTAQVLKRKRVIINVPFLSPSLSKIWVAKVTSSSKNLVYPLIESLKHNMVVNKSRELKIKDHRYIPFLESLQKGVSFKNDSWVRSIIDYNSNLNFRWLENVTSIQRLSGLSEINSEKISHTYFLWLPSFLKPFVKVTLKEGKVFFSILNAIDILILMKSKDRSDSTRVVYYITGGLLAKKTTLNGRLEFRTISSPECVLVALLDYRPALPWFIYKYTQAFFHLWVMKFFQRKLKRS